MRKNIEYPILDTFETRRISNGSDFNFVVHRLLKPLVYLEKPLKRQSKCERFITAIILTIVICLLLFGVAVLVLMIIGLASK